MSLIEIKNLKYRYPGATGLQLDDINISIEKGEFIGIAGENGAGKSTFSQALLGLIPQFYKGAYGGSVVVDGLNAKNAPVADLCRKAGLVFQNPFNQLSGAKDTVYDEVGYGLQNLGIEPAEIRSRIEDVLKRFGIWEFRSRNPFDLSGGQLQRVAIASVLAMNPDILILDEPTSQLDPAGSEEVFRTVDALTESGITIIMIEQKIEKLAEYCDKIMLMHKGKLIAFDTPDSIFSRDDLFSYGVMPPAYTVYAKKNGLKLPNGNYPVKKEELLELIRKGPSDSLSEKRPLPDSGFCFKYPFGIAERPSESLISKKKPAASLFGKDETVSAASGTPDSTFTVEDLHFSYIPGNEIFKGINLELDRRPTAIIGQNGAGKTTLVRILKGLLKPDSGRLTFKGQDIASKTVAELAGKVGYVFQNPDDQIFKYKVLDEVMFGPLNIGMTQEEAKLKASEALQAVGLEWASEKNPYDLELSDRKMVAIASVLSMDTDVIILDEPTIAQDCKGREKIREIIKELSSKGKLIIAILHDMDFVAQSFERVIAMAHGEILADGTPYEIFRNQTALKEAALTPPYLVSLMEELETGYDNQDV